MSLTADQLIYTYKLKKRVTMGILKKKVEERARDFIWRKVELMRLFHTDLSYRGSINDSHFVNIYMTSKDNELFFDIYVEVFDGPNAFRYVAEMKPMSNLSGIDTEKIDRIVDFFFEELYKLYISVNKENAR